jgi:hypothetical protein
MVDLLTLSSAAISTMVLLCPRSSVAAASRSGVMALGRPPMRPRVRARARPRRVLSRREPVFRPASTAAKLNKALPLRGSGVDVWLGQAAQVSAAAGEVGDDVHSHLRADGKPAEAGG